MNRIVPGVILCKVGMPHVCGDEPDKETGTETETDVCPTYVGMNRTFTVQPCGVKCMPHVCGDEPPAFASDFYLYMYAPRMWG